MFSFSKNKNSQYIFSINTGRAGSNFLAELLSSDRSICSLHEPEPTMTKSILDLITKNSYKSTYNDRLFKVSKIKETCKRNNCKTYIETNHMFIKTFYDVVCNELDNVKVIYLKRDFMKTLKSFADLRYFSDLNPISREWMVSPNAITKAINCIATNDKDLDYIDLSIAYLIDIEGRAERFKKEYPNIPIYTVNLEELNDLNSVKTLLDWLELPFKRKNKNKIGKKVNNRNLRKKELGEEIDMQVLIERVKKYYNRTKEMNIALPSSIESYFKSLDGTLC